jgi:ABC-2 type transport system ATP-binding protein
METSIESRPEVVHVAGVRKSFVVNKDNTLKDRVFSLFRGRRRRSSFTALDGVSLSIEAGTTVGLLGANGSGKSTLLKLIGGILTPDAGSVKVRGRVAALLELGAGFHPDLSGRENVYLNAALLGLSRAETDALFDDIVDFSGIAQFIDNEVKFYSSGMYMRLAFAVAVHTDPDVLLVDEVLAVGDEGFQRKCMDKIHSFQREGRTIIIVSHSASQITELCDTTFVLDGGGVVFHGPAREGVAALREVLAERQKAGAGSQSDVGEAPSVVTVTGVETFDAAGDAASDFLQDAPMTIRLHVHATEDIDDWAVDFGVDTPAGQLVIGSGTAPLGTTMMPLRKGESRSVDFAIASLHLGRGDYFINARAIDQRLEVSSVLWQAALIHVAGPDGTKGLASLEVTASELDG